MTYVITSICRGYVLQTGDRLLTLRGTRDPFDPFANKAIVYTTRDAIVAISYAGTAYISGITTDEWVAAALADTSLARPDGRGAVRLGAVFHPARNLGQSIAALRDSLDNAREMITVIAAGFAWDRRGRVRPVLWRISAGSTGVVASHDREVARLPSGDVRTVPIGSGAAHCSPEIESEIAAAITVNAGKGHAAHTAAIRFAAAQEGDKPIVGDDCLSIVIRRPPPLWAAVRFDPVLTSGHSSHLAYTPFVVTPFGVHYPSVLEGEATFCSGDLEVLLEAPPPPPPMHRSMGSVRRPPPPSLRPRPRLPDP